MILIAFDSMTITFSAAWLQVQVSDLKLLVSTVSTSIDVTDEGNSKPPMHPQQLLRLHHHRLGHRHLLLLHHHHPQPSCWPNHLPKR
jgi:hypothetical protein